MAYLSNPYSGADGFTTIALFFKRIFLLMQGKTFLASDELQIVILSLIAMSAAIVGVFLIYRKMTMLANALSHSVLFGIAIAYLILRSIYHHFDLSMNLQSMFLAALISGFLTAFLSQMVIKISRLQKDAAIGLVFTTLFAIGVLLISIFSRNSHIGIELVMGNVDALHINDLPYITSMLCLIVAVVTVFFGGLKITTFDPIYASLRGTSPTFYNYLVIFLLSITSMGAFRAVGIVLVLSFFIVPPLIAKNHAKTLETQILLAAVIGIISSILGVAASRHILTCYQIALSTGGITVLVLYSLFFLNWAFFKLLNSLKKVNLLNKLKLNPPSEV